MINRNLPVHSVIGKAFALYLDDPEVSALVAKYGPVLNFKVSRPTEPGTERQNRAMHSLLTEYYKTGMSSAPDGCKLDQFKIFMKLQYGPCYEMEQKGQIVRIPKSWSDYTKQERTDFIEGLLSEIYQSGAFVESRKIQEIVAGMSDE